jgi:hypothetical protein
MTKDYMKEDNSALWAESKARRDRKRTGEAIVMASVTVTAPHRPGEVVKKLRGNLPMENVKSDDFPPPP